LLLKQAKIGFFTFYIIPLAKKLKDCGVCGVSSDDFLNYAKKNLKKNTRKLASNLHPQMEVERNRSISIA